MSAFFPSSVATTLQLLQAVNNTKVLLDVDCGIGDTTITVDDASPLPASGYLTFDDNAASPETIYYTGVSGNDLTGVTRGADNTAAATHSSSASPATGLEQRWNADYHNRTILELIAVEQNLSDRLGLDSGTHVLKIVDGTVALPAVQFASDPNSGLYRIGSDNIALATNGVKALEVTSTQQVGVTAGLVSAPGLTFSGDLNTGLYSIGADIIGIATGGVVGVTVNATQQFTIPKTSNQIILGTTNTTTISATAPASSAVYTIPDVGTTANFILSAGTQTVGGAKTFSTALTVNPASNQLVLGVTRTVTINAPTPASSSRTWTIPDISADGTFAALEGTQTFSGVKTFSANANMVSINGTFVGLGRNRLTNGDVSVDQANAGASVSISTGGGAYSADMFLAVGTGSAGVYTIQQLTASPPSTFLYYLRATVTTNSASPAAGATYALQNVIEAKDVRDFGYGTASAVTVTLSWWVRSSLTGTFSGSLVNFNGPWSYTFNYTINSANTWEQKSITIAGDQSHALRNTLTGALGVYLDLGCGSTFQTAAGSWTSGTFYAVSGATKFISTNGATWDMTGMQLEIGSTVTSFETVPYDRQLQKCQRYYQVVGGNVNPESIIVGQAFTTTQVDFCLRWAIPMRATPTVTINNATNFKLTTSNATLISLTALAPAGANITSVELDATIGSASLVAGNASVLYSANLNATIVADARM